MSQQEPRGVPAPLNVKFAAASNLPKITSAEIPAIRIIENLSEEDKEAQEKGSQLLAQMEHLFDTDESFSNWLQIGLDQIEAGETVTFDANGWQE